MARPKYPSDQADKTMVRFPGGLMPRIRAAAEANGRSMNSEIVARLEDTFAKPTRDQLYAELRAERERRDYTEGQNVNLMAIASAARAEADKLREINHRIRDESKAAEQFSTLDAEHRQTAYRLSRMEQQLGRLLSQITNMRERSEFVQGHPDRLTPERVARRAGIRDCLEQEHPTYQNPYPSGTMQADEYRNGFHQTLVRRIGGDAVRSDPRWKEILPRRVREELYPEPSPSSED